MHSDSFQDTVFLGGPTASGKSAVALALAERLNGAIISVDSMQVYRGLDIGTAKPSAAERARVPHYLLDVADIDQPFDAACFVRLAREAVAEIRSQGRVPVFCGGTGLYFKVLLEGVGESPGSDPAVREALAATPLETMLEELHARDPLTYERIDRQNPRRVIRALAVIRATGRPFSEMRAAWTEEDQPPRFFVVLAREAEDLKQRIDARVDAMFREGLVEETRVLLERGLARNLTAMQAIGYRQVVEYLQGVRSMEETVALVKSRTRKFAKRQLTWYKYQTQARWLTLGPEAQAGKVAQQLASEYIDHIEKVHRH